MTKIAKILRVNGRVQGVGFRWSTWDLARKMAITGTVANESDGSVTIVAVGEPLNMAHFTAKIKAGPSPYSRVATYEETPLNPVPQYDSFEVTG